MDPIEKRKLLDENRRKERERKARTRMLFRMGEISASYGFERPEDLENLLTSLANSPEGRELLEQHGARQHSP